jgi:hypothetical protein
MAGGYPVPFVHANGTSMGYASFITGTMITSGAANTKGSWTQIVASTAADFTHLYLSVDGQPSLSSRSIVFDIAAAPAGSESSGLIAQNILYELSTQSIWNMIIPCGMLAAGSRIAMRTASVTASDATGVGLIGLDSGWLSSNSGSGIDTYGWSGSGNVQGISVDPGGTVFPTKGAYTQITPSSTNSYCGFFLGFDNLNGNPAADDATTLIDVALGSSGSEKIILPNVQVTRNFFGPGNGYQMAPNHTDIFYIPIGSGNRIAVRASCNINTATDRLIGVSFYGVRR